MSFMVQALVLLISGVYYAGNVLPGCRQAVRRDSPTRYLRGGARPTMMDGRGSGPGAGLAAEYGAKATGRLKRRG
jgi:hypothetical protein